jgi:hypothetical protein
MLNRIAEATGTFIPVSSLLLDVLEMKELGGKPDAVGKAVNLFSVKQVYFLVIQHFLWEDYFEKTFNRYFCLAGR